MKIEKIQNVKSSYKILTTNLFLINGTAFMNIIKLHIYFIEYAKQGSFGNISLQVNPHTT